MQTVEVRLWDDLHGKRGERVPAEVQMELELKVGKAAPRRVRVDLTGVHGKELEDLLAPYFEAGQRTDARPVAGAFSPGSREARNFRRDLRAWADSVGRSAEYRTEHSRGGTKNNYKYPLPLVRDYEAYLLEQVS